MNAATRPKPAHARVVVFTTIAVVVIAVAVTLITTFGHPETPTGSGFPSAEPDKITRADMMTQYARIAPFDSSATPATIDELADGICTKLEQGESTDDLITSATQVYQSQATSIVRLFVSYDCPAYLKDFK